MAGPQLSRLVCLAATLCALGALGALAKGARRMDTLDREMSRAHEAINQRFDKSQISSANRRNNNTHFRTYFKTPWECETPEPWPADALRKRKQRIAGGEDADLVEFDSFVGIMSYNGIRRRFSCGGVLLTSNIVLTAAHCLKDRIKFLVAPSEIHQAEWEKRGIETYNAKMACLSTDYLDELDEQWDFGVLVLDRPIPVGGTVKTACMTVKDMYPGDIVQIPGLGHVGTTTDQDGFKIYERAPVLQKATQKVIKCDRNHGHRAFLCTSSVSSSQANSICLGDSGSGVYHWANDTQLLVGLVSFGTDGRCMPLADSYAVHVAVNTYAYNIRDFAMQCLRRAETKPKKPTFDEDWWWAPQ